jgi:DNA-binding MarR family transcriptional regulator
MRAGRIFESQHLNTMIQFLEKLNRAGIRCTKPLVLLRLADGDKPMSALAGLCGVTTAGITGAVDALERAGLVGRRHVPSDRRILLVTLTVAGREMVAQNASIRGRQGE